MAFTNAMVRGKPTQIAYPISAGVAIGLGDFLWWNGTTLKSIGGSANLVTTWSSEAQARRAATGRFVGIANFQTFSTSLASMVSIDSGAVAEVKVASSTYKIGDLLGFQKDAAGNYLYAGQLQKVVHPFDAVAICLTRATSAVTTVEAFILSSREQWNALAASVGRLSFYVGATGYSANAGTVLNDYNFGMAVKVCGFAGIVDAATTGANILQLKNGANTLDDTLTIPGSSAQGTYVYQAVDDAADYNLFEHNDSLDVVSDSGSTASGGSATIIVEFFARPVL